MIFQPALREGFGRRCAENGVYVVMVSREMMWFLLRGLARLLENFWECGLVF